MAHIPCAICFEPLKDPVSTPCGHLFCHKCLKDSIVDLGQKAAEGSCPTCRLEFPLANLDLEFVPDKYHRFLHPAIRKIFLDDPEEEEDEEDPARSAEQAEADRARIAALEARVKELEASEATLRAENADHVRRRQHLVAQTQQLQQRLTFAQVQYHQQRGAVYPPPPPPPHASPILQLGQPQPHPNGQQPRVFPQFGVYPSVAGGVSLPRQPGAPAFMLPPPVVPGPLPLTQPQSPQVVVSPSASQPQPQPPQMMMVGRTPPQMGQLRQQQQQQQQVFPRLAPGQTVVSSPHELSRYQQQQSQPQSQPQQMLPAFVPSHSSAKRPAAAVVDEDEDWLENLRNSAPEFYREIVGQPVAGPSTAKRARLEDTFASGSGSGSAFT